MFCLPITTVPFFSLPLLGFLVLFSTLSLPLFSYFYVLQKKKKIQMLKATCCIQWHLSRGACKHRAHWAAAWLDRQRRWDSREKSPLVPNARNPVTSPGYTASLVAEDSLSSPNGDRIQQSTKGMRNWGLGWGPTSYWAFRNPQSLVNLKLPTLRLSFSLSKTAPTIITHPFLLLSLSFSLFSCLKLTRKDTLYPMF